MMCLAQWDREAAQASLGTVCKQPNSLMTVVKLLQLNAF